MANKVTSDAGPAQGACKEDGEQPALAAAGSDGSAPGGLPECFYICDQDLSPELIKKIKACAAAITGDKNAVEDIAQQVRLKLLGVSRERWSQIANKPGYVMRVA